MLPPTTLTALASFASDTGWARAEAAEKVACCQRIDAASGASGSPLQTSKDMPRGA